MRAFPAGHKYDRFPPVVQIHRFLVGPYKIAILVSGMEIRFPTPNALFWTKYHIALFWTKIDYR